MTIPPEARDRELYVRCRTCGFSIATGVRAERDDPGVPEGGSTREHRCPRCGAEHGYAGGDYAVRD